MEHAMYHTLLGFCWWDIPAFIILVGIILFLIFRHRRLKKREQELEYMIQEKYSYKDEINLEEEIKY
jgi:cytochrome c-type biogenesis protein CcmH/NrfF